ncbi:MAG: MBL fold metallo-hydrolase [Candidatus Thermoplasmatota archaeon]|nr:MBL fold metallo-hydrolase [Candidatus Thermoplasmatota archaeon]
MITMSEECGEKKEMIQNVSEDGNGKRIGIRRFDIISLIQGRKGGEGIETSSVSLIRTPTSTVVVDTGSSEIKEEIKRAINAVGIKVEKVNVLVTTRAHDLHTGNDSLFVHALQHVRKDDWTKVKGETKRKVAINNRYHWIDRYLKLQTIHFVENDALVLLAHMPNREDMLEASSRDLTGKVVLFAGLAVPGEDDPVVKAALEKIRKEGICTVKEPGEGFKDLVDLLSYCDHVIPAYGPMFRVRGE